MGGESKDEGQDIKNTGQWGVTGWPKELCGAIATQILGGGWSWALTVKTASFIFVPFTSLFSTRPKTSSIFGLHSGEKAECVAGEQNFLPRDAPCRQIQLQAKWPAHLGKKVCPWAHGSSSAALTPSVFPSQESQSLVGPARSVGA